MGGEVLHQLNLFVGKGTDFLAVHRDSADQFIVFQHWDGDQRPYAPKLDSSDGNWVAFLDVEFVRSQISDVNRRFGRQHPIEKVSATETDR